MIYRFVAAEKANHPITTLCRVLGVSRSGFRAWAIRRPSARAIEDARLTERIAAIHEQNKKVYGSPSLERIVEFPRFRGHLSVGLSGPAERMSSGAQDPAVSRGVPPRGGPSAAPWRSLGA